MKTAEERILDDARAAEQDATDFLRREDSAVQKQWTDRNFVTKTRENARVKDPVDDVDGRIESAILREREHLVEAIGLAMADFVRREMASHLEDHMRALDKALHAYFRKAPRKARNSARREK
jgi:hypothetical protein